MASAPQICNGCEKDELIQSLCVKCEELFCHECTVYHRKCRTTRSHPLVDASHHDNDFNNSTTDIGCGNDCPESSISLCLDCRQVLCDNCTTKHSLLKATKDHQPIAVKLLSLDTASLSSEPSSSNALRRSSVVSHSHSELSHAQVRTEKGTYMGIFTHEFMSSAPGDKEVTRVRGIAILPDDKIIVADYKNRSLKLYNQNLRLEMAKDLKEDPRGMAATSVNVVAVTIADKKEIRLYKIEGNKIRTHKTFKVKEKPYSIAHNRDYLAVETGEGEDGAIRIYDLNGTEHFVIPGNTRSFGQFTGNTIRLALDFSKRAIFVADIVKETIHRVDFKGTLTWSVKLASPRGLVLHNETIFVASSEANRIYQISANDGLVYRLLDEDNRIKRPRYLALKAEKDNMTLAVEIDGNHIKLYRITKEQL